MCQLSQKRTVNYPDDLRSVSERETKFIDRLNTSISNIIY